jgi:type II secretory pathway component GspD/PulD (secretin)
VFFIPTNTPFTSGITMTVQPVVSADRRFVRIALAPTITTIAPNIPLVPVIIPTPQLFEGGGGGNLPPVVFQQFLQQPVITTITVSTTVTVPDGGTVLLGGLKTLVEGRNEFGPPILSKIPYINRLFKNVGYGRETRSLLIMVTPRIIINEEEEQIFLGNIAPIPGRPIQGP